MLGSKNLTYVVWHYVERLVSRLWLTLRYCGTISQDVIIRYREMKSKIFGIKLYCTKYYFVGD